MIILALYNNKTVTGDDTAIINEAKQMGKRLYELYDGDSTVGVCDSEKWVAYYEGEKIKLGITVGDKMPEKSISKACITGKRRIARDVTKENSPYGVSYSAISIPFLNGSKAVAAVSVTIPNIKQNALIEMATALRETSTNTKSATEAIANNASDIAASVQELFHSSTKAQNEISTIGDVINLIKQIADQTRLLSLNAAIESARAGDAGKGFGVVANEIKKLAQETTGNVAEISKKLSSITDVVESIGKKVSELDILAQNQAAATEQINASISDLENSAQEITDMANS